MLTFEQIKELIELIADHGLEGVSIERSGFKIEIVGSSPAPRPAVASPQAVAAAAPSPAPAAEPATPATAPAAAREAASEEAGTLVPENAELVSSPIVGTFYSSPNPEADPYVRVGDRVRQGQVLCIVEAMKLMNEIECEVSGVLVEIYPKNAQPVEFGEPLFAIQPD